MQTDCGMPRPRLSSGRNRVIIASACRNNAVSSRLFNLFPKRLYAGRHCLCLDLTEGGTPSIEMVVFGRLPQVQVAKADSQ